MGRTGVTLQEVEQAAAQLQGRGKNPTVDAIRAFLGTGSKSTITQHLNVWKSKTHEAQGKLPPELLSLVSGLWERLNGQADKRITDIETAAKEEIQATKQTLYQSQREQAELKAQLHQLEENLSHELRAKVEYEKQSQREQQEHAKLSERHQVQNQQLADYKAENARLHQLATHIQANLEHYQNAMQQARIEQNAILEKQQMKFQQELTVVQRELTVQRSQSQELEQMFKQKDIELQQLKEQHDLLKEKNDHLASRLQESLSELIIFKDRSEQYQQQLKNYQNDFEYKNQKIIEFEKQTAILSDHCDQFKKSLLAAEDKIELLRQEKLFLSHEKAQLEGNLKQLEKSKFVEANH